MSDSSLNLTHLPHDVLFHCLLYIHTRSDRFGLQVSCKTLHKVSNSDKMLAHLDLGGDVTSLANRRITNYYDELDDTQLDDENDGDADVDDANRFVMVRRLRTLRHRGNIIGGNDGEDVEDGAGNGEELNILSKMQ